MKKSIKNIEGNMQKTAKRSILALLVCLVFGSVSMFAATAKTADKDADQTLRATAGVYDLQSNTVSNIQFDITNYGIWGLNIRRNEASGRWPRGSANNYIFGGGIWFGAKKIKPGTNEYKNYVEVSYNPNSGQSWMAPGRIAMDPKDHSQDAASTKESDITKYRTYFSIDFNPATGKPLNEAEGQAWPIWDANPDPDARLKFDRYFGYYIEDEGMRSTDVFAKGPAIISGEDIFCTFKDTDLSRYEGGATQRKIDGYPMRLQFDQMIYSWGYGRYKDFIFMVYNIYNASADTLHKCWMAPVLDVDIAVATNASQGAANDRTSFYFKDSSLNLAYQWSGSNYGEKDKGFGYLGFDFLESPAVFQKRDTIEKIETRKEVDTIIERFDDLGNVYYDTTWKTTQVVVKEIRLLDSSENGYVRKDKPYYQNAEQLGLVTCNNWAIKDDKLEDDDRYNFMAKGVRDGDNEEGDKRFMMATGPFNMRPKDTVRIVVGVLLSVGSKGGDCDGSEEDLAALIDLDKFAQAVYDSNFRAPAPPDRSAFGRWTPLNNGVKLTWDSTAEMSFDSYERGLDFMGYSLFRAKEPNVSANENYSWKLLRTWRMRTPFVKSTSKPISDDDVTNMPYIDEFRIVGPVTDANGNVTDSMSVKVIRVGTGMEFYSDTYLTMIQNSPDNPLPTKFKNRYYPIISEPDTSVYYAPWGNYFAKYANPTPYKVQLKGQKQNFIQTLRWYDPAVPDPLFNDVLLGEVTLNKAQLKYNPLFYKKKTITIDDTVSIPDDGIIYRTVGGNLTTTADTIYFKNTFKKVEINGKTSGVIDAFVPFNRNLLFTDLDQINIANDTLKAYIQRRVATAKYPDFEQKLEIRRDVIVPYMAQITDNRTFIDIGDDNGDNKVTLHEDVLKTEKLINNMPYYYVLLAFDEGDYQQPTPFKLNDASLGLVNMIETYPREGRVANTPTFEIIKEETDKLGGLYNFKFYALDNERVNQLFGDRVFKLEFTPYWYGYDIAMDTSKIKTKFGLYGRRMTITDTTTKAVIYDGTSYLETTPCDYGFKEAFTERGASYVWSTKPIIDTTNNTVYTFGDDYSKESVVRTGRFSSGDYQTAGYCYSPNWSNEAAGTMAFEFDFSIRQFGGIFRPDSTTLSVAKGPSITAVTPVKFLAEQDKTLKTTPLGLNPLTLRDAFGSFNNGPGEYRVEFLPGGEETVELAYGKKGTTNKATFKLKYLNLKVTNVVEHKRPAGEGEGADSLIVKYPGEMPHITLPSVKDLRGSNYGFTYLDPFSAEVVSLTSDLPKPTNLYVMGKSTDEFIGKFNIHSFGWVNGRGENAGTKIPNQVARGLNPDLTNSDDPYSGLQGRYYLSGESDEATPKVIDFTHIINISGVPFILDYANKGRRYTTGPEWETIDPKTYVYGDDFKAGDVITLKTTGGALGLPLPGASVYFKVNKTDQDNRKITDGLLDKVNIIPNPYYVSHIGQKSPYDAKIYFTKLPKEAKIEIYTITGDLIVTINHNEKTSPEADKVSVEVWDLLSKNGQRVASQTMAAVITTPDGAQTIKNFTVVVGGFRVIED